jgi:SAM-dependent methyltransferase
MTQWNELFGESWTFDDFPNRAFLESVLERLPASGEVLEYGCGTGPAACFLAARDVILDSYCLQSIVTDPDRANVLAAVRDRLKPNGHYILSTAMYDPDRVYERDFRYDATSGICYERTTGPAGDAVQLDNTWYLPHRRHLRPEALRAELERAGLRVVSQDGGNVISVGAFRPEAHQ